MRARPRTQQMQSVRRVSGMRARPHTHPVQGVRRGVGMRARPRKRPVQGVWRVGDMRTRPRTQTVQGVRWVGDMRARPPSLRVQGVQRGRAGCGGNKRWRASASDTAGRWSWRVRPRLLASGPRNVLHGGAPFSSSHRRRAELRLQHSVPRRSINAKAARTESGPFAPPGPVHAAARLPWSRTCTRICRRACAGLSGTPGARASSVGLGA